ncbi:MAG: general secretion pathway protein GspB [Haliea sp.]|nr:general secretion pathway protein GspB [Haliea sp.]
MPAEPVPEPGFDAEPVQAYSPEENAEVARLYSNPPKEEPVVQRDSRSAARQNDATAGSSGEQKSIDIDRILREAREEVENASLSEHPVPFLIDLSQQVKDSIPTVYYLRHDYSSNASLSTVVLNSKTLSVGGSPVPGMKIEEILPDSVVLNYQGTQFRLRALNSWVNL